MTQDCFAQTTSRHVGAGTGCDTAHGLHSHSIERQRPQQRVGLPSRVAAVVAFCAALSASSGGWAQAGGSSTAGAANCAALGEGFVRMPGSETCVRMRGAVRAETFSNGTASNGGGFGNTATDLGGGTQSTTADPWKQAR